MGVCASSSALASSSPCFIYLSLAELMAVGLGWGENMAPFQNQGEQLCEQQWSCKELGEEGGAAGMPEKDEDRMEQKSKTPRMYWMQQKRCYEESIQKNVAHRSRGH